MNKFEKIYNAIISEKDIITEANQFNRNEKYSELSRYLGDIKEKVFTNKKSFDHQTYDDLISAAKDLYAKVSSITSDTKNEVDNLIKLIINTSDTDKQLQLIKQIIEKYSLNAYDIIEKLKQHGLHYSKLDNKIILYFIKKVPPTSSHVFNDLAEKTTSNELLLALVKRDDWFIKYIKNPDKEVQLDAVTRSGYAIKYIKNPTKEVQLAAVSHNGYIIQYIKNPDKEVQLAAVSKNGLAIDYIKNPDPEVLKYYKEHYK